ncbi:hypothetical protein Tco_1395055 [Tanacetum coccineum]
MHTRASNSELVEPLPEPERTLNRRLRRQNRRVPYDQRNNPPQHPRIVYSPILNINYFCHFLDILRNYDPMDDESMWAADRVVASTPSFAITILETTNEFAIKEKQKHGWTNSMKELSKRGMNFKPLSSTDSFPPALFDRLLGEIRAFSQHENESLTDAWLRMKEMLRNCHAGGIFLYNTPNQAYQLFEDKVLLKLDWAKNQKTKSSLQKTVAFTDEAKNHQALIQNLETKFDRLADKQSSRPSGSLPSNTQPNPRGSNSKAYQPPQARNEHVNVVFTRSGKSYNPPDNLDDQ